jgi:hypothetical protein
MVMRKMSRKISQPIAVISAFASSGLLVLWLLTTLGWGRWVALQGPNQSYIGKLADGSLTFLIANISPDKERPATSQWQLFGGSHFIRQVGVLRDRSAWSRIGMIRTVERIPHSDGLWSRSTTAPFATWNAYCRSFIVPLWMIAAVAAVIPLRRLGSV